MERPSCAQAVGWRPLARWVGCGPIDGGHPRSSRDCRRGASVRCSHGWNTATTGPHGTRSILCSALVPLCRRNLYRAFAELVTNLCKTCAEMWADVRRGALWREQCVQQHVRRTSISTDGYEHLTMPLPARARWQASASTAPSTVRPLARDLRVLNGWQISFGFWSGRALATGTAWAGLCLIHHHQAPASTPKKKTFQIKKRTQATGPVRVRFDYFFSVTHAHAVLLASALYIGSLINYTSLATPKFYFARRAR